MGWPFTGPGWMHINFCPGRGDLVLSMGDYLSQSGELALNVLTPFPAAAPPGRMSELIPKETLI